MLRCMKCRMFTTTNYFQIRESVIFNVMIFMVHYFIKIKSSIKKSFHNKSVFSYIFRFSTTSLFLRNPYKSISKIIYLLSTCPVAIKTSFSRTFERTKSYFMSSSTMQSLTRFFTVFTWWSWYECRHIYTIDVDG